MQCEPATSSGSLRVFLDHEPVVLRFGTSGRRGEVVHLTQLEVYLNALAELEYLQSLPLSAGGVRPGDDFYLAYDLRPSSSRFVGEEQGRGELAQAIVRAIRDAGMHPVNLGRIPTPALAFHAWERATGAIMVTGSHIPFDRNGYKTCSAKSELLKEDEAPINARVEQVRARLYGQPYAESAFDRRGMFKCGHQELPREEDAGRAGYWRRYTDFFPPEGLRGLRLIVYQHSAVGRDVLVDLLKGLGAEVVPVGRSETFVPIDTENMDAEQLGAIAALAGEIGVQAGPSDAIVATDGDSDRPLVLGFEPVTKPQARARCRVRFFGGDLVGMIVAEFLGANAVVVPISCNDAIDRGSLKDRLEPKTRIGSPYVIAGMDQARRKGRHAICGWESNGGFLTGSDVERNGRVLRALPTRDAVLPILSVLFSMAAQKLSLPALFAQLPRRFSRAALLRKFPQPAGRRIIKRFSPRDEAVKDVSFEAGGVRASDGAGGLIGPTAQSAEELSAIRDDLARFFPARLGFGEVAGLNYVDGIRIRFRNGDVAHIRPSGNADELRIYAVADNQARADAIASLGVAEPDGLLRQMERTVG